MSDGIRRISPKKLTTETVLGEGSFGVVYKGSWKWNKNGQTFRTVVAVKILKNQTLISNAWDEVERLNRLDHPNILTIYGVSVPSGYAAPWIVTEYMPNGDLHSYISSYPGCMTFMVMVKFAYGIACGMEYLHHEMEQRHGDLAARNCLVGPDETVKIGDFGKFEENYEDCYYDCGNGLPCPIRWMPPENVPKWNNSLPRFTRKGDVWAYGVVLFEIWSKAYTPFDELNDQQVINALSKGETPKDHRNVNARWYILDILDDCWQFNPQDRPNFKQIKQDLEKNAGNFLEID